MTDTFRFGRAELRLSERQLLLDGEPASLGARAFDVLALLVAQRHRVVGKDELLAAAWPGVVVEENNLQVQISTLRKLLGAGAITTVPGQGYRFTAPIADAPSAYGATASGVGIFAQHPSQAPEAEARRPADAAPAPPASPVPIPALPPVDAEVRIRSDAPAVAAAAPDGAPSSGTAPAPADGGPPMRPDAFNRWLSWIVWLAALAAIGYSGWMFTRDRAAPAGQGPDQRMDQRTGLHTDRAAGTSAAPGAEQAVGPSVAVLPFVDLSEKKDQEYFSDGLSESLIDRLAKIPNLRVPARTSCFYFKGKSEDVTEIARKLRVSHVLEGSVRKSGGTIRVTAQLVRADNGYHVWSETFDRNETDIFKVQDQVAGAVAAALRLSMRPGSELLEPPPSDIDAYNLLLQARFALARFDQADVQQAADLFEQSARREPTYAAAWSGAAVARRWLADFYDPSPDEDVARARAAAGRALALNPRSVEAHVVLAIIHQNYDFDWPGAEAELGIAEGLEPNDIGLQSMRAYRSLIRADFPTAVAQMESLVDRDPLDAGQYRFLGLALLGAGRPQDAERAVRRGLEVSPGMSSAYYTLVRILLTQHDTTDAVAAARLEQDGLYRRTALAVALRAAGQRAEAKTMLDQLIAHDASGAAFQIAEVYAAQGDREAAFQWLQRAYRQHDSGLVAMKVNNFLRPLADDPRFKELAAKVGLPPT